MRIPLDCTMLRRLRYEAVKAAWDYMSDRVKEKYIVVDDGELPRLVIREK